MTPFDYVRVHDLKETFRLLSEHAGGAALLAGGTDLIGKIRTGRAAPRLLIDLKGISGLEAVRYEPGVGLSIGALATVHSLEISSTVIEKFPALAQAAASLGTYQVRCRATLGGNICNGSPAADMAPALLALGAKARAAGFSGERSVPLDDFFIGPGRTCMEKGEVLLAVEIPEEMGGRLSAYRKHGIRKALDAAVAGVAVSVRFSRKTRTCDDVRIALGAVGPVPVRAAAAEEVLRGETLDERRIAAAAEAAAGECRPITDVRASAGYRREMVGVLTGRILTEFSGRLREEEML